MNIAVARCASASTHYLAMKKIQDWQCSKDAFPSLVVELDGVGEAVYSFILSFGYCLLY
uniref:Uncharacterized protein n=1 Tax=Aegilops tauschii subsp. strangulata TaxID=200361 RepID=A0A452Y594_AEGTS